MPSLSSLKKEAEKRAKESAGVGSVKTRAIEGLVLEKDLRVIDHVLINDLKFINADGVIVDYIESDREVVDGEAGDSGGSKGAG